MLPGAGPRRHVDGHPGDQPRIPRGRLTHLTAVSGANVTIVCGAVLFSSRLIGPRAAVGLAGAALVVFVIVVQPTASVLRAAVMGAIALLGVLSVAAAASDSGSVRPPCCC